MLRHTAAAAALLAMAGCAKNPNDIAPLAVPTSNYANFGCDTLYAEWRSLDAKYSTADRSQRNARHADTFGVFLVGVPMGSLSGADRESEIAYLKGQIAAAQTVMTHKGCTYS